jgi:cobalt/nickel transport protein
MKLVLRLILISLISVLWLSAPAFAHFQMIIPSTEIVSTAEQRDVSLRLMFAHPMSGPSMDMARPTACGVHVGGKKQDLLDTLTPMDYKGHAAYKTTYTIKRPGDHVFWVEPAPYWEPSEGLMIVHYTKVVVNAMGLEQGWDEELGLETEIVPLVRPYGLWTGNQFRGIVKKNGNPVPFAEIEVEYFNEDNQVEIPASPFETQVIKADSNGVFSYTMPRAGWWGFAALSEADEKMSNPAGEEVPVEIGAVIWVKTRDMK